MAWVVDTCLILDIGLNDPQFAAKSERLLESKTADGLVICPVTFVELAPAFGGRMQPLENFLLKLDIDYREEWTREDTREAGAAWTFHVQKRRAKQAVRRPVADVLIGAFAARFSGLLTRNSADFRSALPNLKIVEP